MSVTSIGLCVLEYIDGSGDIDRVGAGDVGEAYDEPRTELGLRGGGGGTATEVFGSGVCDTVLERPREKMNGREGRDEDVAEEAEEEDDAVACDCPLDAISEIFAPKVGGKNVLTVD